MSHSSLENRLIIFTKYPNPGTTKTRLIPELGAEQAADLQRRMTERIVGRMKKHAGRDLRVTVAYANADREDVRSWLGPEDEQFRIIPQSDGDLGDRMSTAFQRSAEDGFDRTLIIGTDCPQLKWSTVETGFRKLDNHDLVLGPSRDGGYYLIGLTGPKPELFSGINWGTSDVFDRTTDIAEQQALDVATLKPMTDVDRADDLHVLDDLSLPE